MSTTCPIQPLNIKRNKLQFLLWQDLYNALDSTYLAQITNKNSQIIVDAEQLAISQVNSYLNYTYDIDYELRPIEQFELYTEYQDFTRLKVEYNKDQQDFGTNWNIDILSQELEPGQYYIAVKNSNTVPSKTIPFYTDNSRYPYSTRSGDKSYRLATDTQIFTDNPDYDETLGYVSYGINGLKYFTGKYKNYYNSVYMDNIIIDLDYSDIDTEEELLDYYGNPEYFDQYDLTNISKEFSNDDRNLELIQTVVQLTIYNLLQRVAAHDISEHRKKLYDDTMANLQNWSKGLKPIKLKLKADAIAKNKNGFIWGNSYTGYRYDY